MATTSSGVVTFACAKQLTTDPHSGFEIVSHRQHITLPWSCLGRVRKAVKRILQESLMLYNSELKGVPVAINKVKLLEPFAKIIDDQPAMHFNILVEYAAFKPKIGTILKGEVSKVQQSHVCCLVHGCFTATLPIPSHLSHKDFEAGQTVFFFVLRIEMALKLIIVKGKYVADPSLFVKKDVSSDNPSLKKSKRAKHERLPDVIPDLTSSAELPRKRARTKSHKE